MDAANLVFTIGDVASLVVGVGGALTVWFNLKGKVEFLEHKWEGTNNNIIEIATRLHNLELEVKENRMVADSAIGNIKVAMKEMENTIIKEIHQINKK